MMLCNSYAADWTCSCQINGQAGPLILLEQASQQQHAVRVASKLSGCRAPSWSVEPRRPVAPGDNAPSTLHHMYSYLAMLFLMQVRRSLHCRHHGMRHTHLCVVSVMCMWMQLVGNMRSIILQWNPVTQLATSGLLGLHSNTQRTTAASVARAQIQQVTAPWLLLLHIQRLTVVCLAAAERARSLGQV